jgi:hypothetical protein
MSDLCNEDSKDPTKHNILMILINGLLQKKRNYAKCIVKNRKTLKPIISMAVYFFA